MNRHQVVLKRSNGTDIQYVLQKCLQSSSSSLSPAAASYYAQILALSSSAQELQSASSSVPGERCHQLSRLIIDVLLFKESIRSSVCAWRVLLHLDPQVGAQLLPSTVFGL
jgi:hypothetical protein